MNINPNSINEPLVSIIMGVYNAEKTMQDSIDSILQQTYTKWEFIICDDGSTDNTYSELQKKYEGDDRFVIIKNEENSGLPFTLNHCIKHCSGDYIARMDADDISYPDRFEKQLDYLYKHPEISFVSSCVDIFDGDKITSIRKLPEFPTKRQMVYNTCFVHPATMFRAEALKSIGMYRVSEETRRGQDYDLFMRMYGADMRGANLQTPVYRYTEDVSAIKRRSFQGRVWEYKIRRTGYKAMRVYPWAFPYLFKPFAAYFLQNIKGTPKK